MLGVVAFRDRCILLLLLKSALDCCLGVLVVYDVVQCKFNERVWGLHAACHIF